MNGSVQLSQKINRLCMLFGNNANLLAMKLQVLQAQCKNRDDAKRVANLVENIKGLI